MTPPHRTAGFENLALEAPQTETKDSVNIIASSVSFFRMNPLALCFSDYVLINLYRIFPTAGA